MYRRPITVMEIHAQPITVQETCHVTLTSQSQCRKRVTCGLYFLRKLSILIIAKCLCVCPCVWGIVSQLTF